MKSFGNDIVDLKSREKPLHERFIERVFSTEEQTQIGRDPTSIWRFWAAKEAAFKTIARLNPETVFSHREFRCNDEGTLVTYGDFKLPCLLKVTEDYVAALVGMECVLSSLFHWVSEINESEGDLSRAVRNLAKRKISEHLGVSEERILLSEADKKNIKVPPTISLEGASTEGWLLSYSHHGRFVAVALLIPERTR